MFYPFTAASLKPFRFITQKQQKLKKKVVSQKDEIQHTESFRLSQR